MHIIKITLTQFTQEMKLKVYVNWIYDTDFSPQSWSSRYLGRPRKDDRGENFGDDNFEKRNIHIKTNLFISHYHMTG
jgi:hypothetical protein